MWRLTSVEWIGGVRPAPFSNVVRGEHKKAFTRRCSLNRVRGIDSFDR